LLRLSKKTRTLAGCEPGSSVPEANAMSAARRRQDFLGDFLVKVVKHLSVQNLKLKQLHMLNGKLISTYIAIND
jgi:hypothetical protein